MSTFSFLRMAVPGALLLLLNACHPSPLPENNAVENETDQCLCKAWAGPADTTGKVMRDGFRLLDRYLLKSGWLGKGRLIDYKKLAFDTNQVLIPQGTDSLQFISLAVNSGSPGAVDANALGKCFDKLAERTRRMDKNAVLAIISRDMDAMKESGAPDTHVLFEDFFAGISEQDFEKPFYKNFYYLFLSSLHPGRFVIETPSLALVKGAAAPRTPALH